VDEINRGNIPKIFGELLFLLEYRDEAVELQYGKDQFSLPENLLLMGTMNTADRSIALVDAALRRRFFFIPFMPTEEPVAGVLRSWLKENERDELPALLLDELNRRIAKDEVAIGPSYLMSGDGSRASLESIWRHAILPLLDEHYYGTKVNVHTEFGLEACLDAVKGGEPRGVDDEGEGALDTNAATPAP
jgi:5-methylcytosine-specific restriction protein B